MGGWRRSDSEFDDVISSGHLNTAMSRNLHLSQIFDLKGKVAFVSGKDLGNPESSAEELMIR